MFHYEESAGRDSHLEIFPLRTDDEGVYKCEITYLPVQDSCSVVQFINLTTYGNDHYDV